MDDVNDGFRIKTPRRVEVLNGAERRRQWPDAAKARIVSEALVPGAVISQVARRHDVLPSQIYAWRKTALGGGLVLAAEPTFAKVEMTPPPPIKAKAERHSAAAIIEVEAGDLAVRIHAGADALLVERIIRVLKAGA